MVKNRKFESEDSQDSSTSSSSWYLLESDKSNTSTSSISKSLDPRSPIYTSFWKRSIPYKSDTFAVDQFEEPHFKRKRTILREHPDVIKLYGYSWISIPCIFGLVIGQIILTWTFSENGPWHSSGWLWFIFCAYILGGSMVQGLGVLIHETTHNLIVPSTFWSRILGLIANIPLLIPVAMSFRNQHLNHHTYQGIFGKDPDLPHPIEIYLVRGNTFKKLIFVIIYPSLYVLRAMLLGLKPQVWEWANLVFTIITNLILYSLLGWSGIKYLFISFWFGYSIHPAAMHFIQEHYTWKDGQETYSYYGFGNFFFFNIGYHNEHHDFAQIPWTRLPALKALAPEFYNPLFAHNSWVEVMWEFLTDKTLGPQSRVERTFKSHWNSKRMYHF